MVTYREAKRVVFRAIGQTNRHKLLTVFHSMMSIGSNPIHQFNSADTIFLTFDDGPNPNSTERIVRELARFDVTATFFCIGQNAVRYPGLVRGMRDAGHEIGNHTMTHPDLHRVSVSTLRREVEGCQLVLQDVVRGPVTSFRAPWGHFRWDLHLLKGDPRYLVHWDVEPNWDESDPEVLADFIVDRTRPGSIILLHDGLTKVDEETSRAVGQAAADSISMFVPKLLAKGMKFGTVGQQARIQARTPSL